MALTDSPKEVVATYKVLLEILQRMTELTQDPQAFEKMTKAAFQLAESEEKKVEEARSTIAQYDALKEEQAKERQALNTYSADLTKRKKDLDDYSKRSEERNNAINTRERQANERDDLHKKSLEKFEQEKSEFAAKVARYEKDRSLLDIQMKEANDLKASLRDKAIKVKEMTEGL